ncbi:MAG: hypothetical protein E3J72_13495 [Planctomycetota bacterium]|nr:MAG: hypothetical protein E3J72_13495 [Planctomycetota bacterium]
MRDQEKQDVLTRARIRLEALRSTLIERLSDRPHVGEMYVKELHDVLGHVAESLNMNLDEFKVSPDYIKDLDEDKRGIEPPLLLAKISAALEYVGRL